MTTIFSVHGPLEVPVYVGKASRTITEECARRFFTTHTAHASSRGCYVFGIRAGKGFTPGYVGRATKSFRQEVFAPHKLSKYQQMLADYQRGTPVLFFLVAPMRKGKPNATHVSELEEFLIQVGVAANENLLNIRGTKEENWGVAGVLRSGIGKPSKGARQFKSMMKL